MPCSVVATLPDEPCGLYERVWAPHAEAATLDVVRCDDQFVDCGTPTRYLSANLASSGGAAVVDPTATVRGTLERTVVWAGAEVAAGEQLVDAIRTSAGQTVLVR